MIDNLLETSKTIMVIKPAKKAHHITDEESQHPYFVSEDLITKNMQSVVICFRPHTKLLYICECVFTCM